MIEHRPEPESNDWSPGREPTPVERMTEAQRLIAAGRLLRDAVAAGHPDAGVTQRLRERMRSPQVGDLVWETSTEYLSLRDPDHAARALGWYVRRGESPWLSREAWDASPEAHQYPGQPYGDSPGREVWVIRPWRDPTSEYAWENAWLLALPLDPPVGGTVFITPTAAKDGTIYAAVQAAPGLVRDTDWLLTRQYPSADPIVIGTIRGVDLARVAVAAFAAAKLP